jgi:hypothetical protein
LEVASGAPEVLMRELAPEAGGRGQMQELAPEAWRWRPASVGLEVASSVGRLGGGAQMWELEAAAVGLEVASGVEEPAAAADIRKEATVWLRREWGWAFFGRGEPCPGAKLDLSFSTGQG